MNYPSMGQWNWPLNLNCCMHTMNSRTVVAHTQKLRWTAQQPDDLKSNFRKQNHNPISCKTQTFATYPIKNHERNLSLNKIIGIIGVFLFCCLNSQLPWLQNDLQWKSWSCRWLFVATQATKNPHEPKGSSCLSKMRCGRFPLPPPPKKIKDGNHEPECSHV